MAFNPIESAQIHGLSRVNAIVFPVEALDFYLLYRREEPEIEANTLFILLLFLAIFDLVLATGR